MNKYTHTHTHIYIYIYIQVGGCICIVRERMVERVCIHVYIHMTKNARLLPRLPKKLSAAAARFPK